MKCPECIKAVKKSIVLVGGGISTLMYCSPYYDENGKYHFHDCNTHTTNYSCSNGHKWVESKISPCPTCGDNWWELQ